MNPRYQTFIIEMIKHGDKLRAYKKTYPKAKGESAIKGAERLLRNPQIAAEISEAISAIHADAYAKACAVHAGLKEVKILSIMKKREILNQIATCELKVGRYVKGDQGYVMVYEDPRPRDIIKSIEVDIRLEEMLNNVRNIEDVKLSRFDIYIDGRPCDDPTAPINPHIPKGLVMLPRKKKKLPEFTGNKKEQNTSEIIVNNGFPLLGGVGVGDLQGTIAQEISREISGNKMEHPDSYRDGETLAHPLSPQGEPQALTLKAELLQNKLQLREKDPLANNFYKDFVRRREQAPQTRQNFFNDGRILTDEEIEAINEAAEKESKSMQCKPSTLGKMYFPARMAEQPGGPEKNPQP